MISPEQLSGEGFKRLLDNKLFWGRVMAIGADEIHLLPTWGALFRKAYEQIARMRARFPECTVVLGVDCNHGRWTSARYRTHDASTGINGRNFPALLWILESRRKTVIYCATISLAFRVTCYLWIHTKDKSNLPTRLRMYTAINFPSYNNATRKILYDDPEPNITVATAAMAQGIDAPDIDDVVIVGEVIDPDEAHQRWGRAGRDRSKVKNARGIMYLTGSAVSKAKTILKGKGKPTKSQGKTKTSAPQMTEGMARMILADCLSAEQDQHYDNPRCVPEKLPSLPTMRTARPSVGDALHRSLQDAARMRLVTLRYEIWREADKYTHGCTPSAAFLPDLTINHLLNNITVFVTVEHVHGAVASNHLLLPHAERLLEILHEICGMRDVKASPGDDTAAAGAEDEDVEMLGEECPGDEQGRSHHADGEQGHRSLDARTSDQPSESSCNELTLPRDSAGPVPDGAGAAREVEASCRPPKGIPAHMYFSWDTGLGAESSKRRATKPASQRGVKKGRIENKENGSNNQFSTSKHHITVAFRGVLIYVETELPVNDVLLPASEPNLLNFILLIRGVLIYCIVGCCMVGVARESSISEGILLPFLDSTC
ncbi:hypothetical protein EWM64_g3164 [Hericium alpestre]|uniref:DNA 3'-5' helicase n=1 Tax=Hericium alpestre TaxID=135208 RepID=A0A4Z0A3E8_9AGAM|nr:hypothetical protein EWM64_g3164 [Hericium alpestre]